MDIKKMFILLLCLIVVYFGFQFSFNMVNHGHEVSYIIKSNNTKLEVKEIYTQNRKNEKNNYYLEINDKTNIFTIQLFDDFKKRNYIIKDIKYMKGSNYTCIYPIFKDEKQYTDILCIKDNIIYQANSINDKEVEEFKESLEKKYDESLYDNDLSETLKKESLIIYKNNIVKNHYLAIENYKGLYLVNKKENFKKIELFENDKYKKELSYFANGKYISADFNKEYSFNEFYLTDIKNGKYKKIISDNALSLDAYVMGNINNKVYIYDKNEKNQYTVDIKNSSISKVGNTASGIKIYEDSKLKDYSSYDAYNNKKLFNEYTSTDLDYERVDKIGNILSGNYYVYEKCNDGYIAYEIPVQNTKSKTYLFKTTNIENIVYQKDYIYFINGDTIYYYRKNNGIKSLVTNKELDFNNTLKFGLKID